MRVLLTGITGFIGGVVADRLLDEGYQVRAQLRPKPGRTGLEHWSERGVEIVEGDLADVAFVAEICRETAVVFHVGWQANRVQGQDRSSMDALMKTNLDGLGNLLDASKNGGVRRFVFTSSVSVYGPKFVHYPRTIFEDSPLMRDGLEGPFWRGYAAPKIAAEQLIRDRLPEPAYFILRPGIVYGKKAPFAGSIVRSHTQRRQARGENPDNPVTVQWVHVNDMADSMLACIKAPATAANQTYNILGQETVSSVELRQASAWLIEQIRSRADWDRDVEFELLPAKFSIEKASRLLGFTPRVRFLEGYEEMLADTLDESA